MNLLNYVSSIKILIVDDDLSLSKLVKRWLELADYEVFTVVSGEECLQCLPEISPSVVLLDFGLPGFDGVSILQKIKKDNSNLPVIMMTADVSVETIVSAMQSGADDYLGKPLNRMRLLTTVRHAVEKSELSLRLRDRENPNKSYETLIGESKPMKMLFKQLDCLSNSSITVSIQGASGTGKELVARAIHNTSNRKNAPFIALNCAAIPESLHEAELFGFEKGTFTGANARKQGKLELAGGGTLFLDEVAEMSLSLQAKLLRVLQEKSFQRLGGTSDIHSDFRLITATHNNLAELVKQGKFREDLYFRIVVFELELPALSQRKDDIPILAQKFLNDFANEGKSFVLSEETLSALKNYSFPGNVRELQNILHRATVIAQNGIIGADDLPDKIFNENRCHSEEILPQISFSNSTRSRNMEEVEKHAIEESIRQANGNFSEAIRQLGIGRATFYRKLKKYEISL